MSVSIWLPSGFILYYLAVQLPFFGLYLLTGCARGDQPARPGPRGNKCDIAGRVSSRMCRQLKPRTSKSTQLNSRVLPIVESASGQKLGAEPEKWKGWWTDQLGYAFQASQPAVKPTFTDFVETSPSSWSASLKCFGAGELSYMPLEVPGQSRRSRSVTGSSVRILPRAWTGATNRSWPSIAPKTQRRSGSPLIARP